jgi:hypothetical protein
MMTYVDNPILFTFVREPFDRTVSHYLYANRLNKLLGEDPVNVQAFIDNSKTMCEYIIEAFPSFDTSNSNDLSEQAISILELFDFVGTTARIHEFPSWFNSVKKYIDFDVIAKENNAPVDSLSHEDNRIRELSKEKLACDIKLYSYVNNRNNNVLSSVLRERRENIRNELDKVAPKQKKRFNHAVKVEYKKHNLFEHFKSVRGFGI